MRAHVERHGQSIGTVTLADVLEVETADRQLRALCARLRRDGVAVRDGDAANIARVWDVDAMVPANADVVAEVERALAELGYVLVWEEAST